MVSKYRQEYAAKGDDVALEALRTLDSCHVNLATVRDKVIQNSNHCPVNPFGF